MAQQQIVGVIVGKIGHLVDIALGDEQIRQAVIVQVGEPDMPSRGRAFVAAGIGQVRVGSDVIGDVGKAGGILVRHDLQPVLDHVGHRQVGQSVAGDVVHGQAHAPDPRFGPAILGPVLAQAVGRQVEKLLVAVGIVILPVVGRAQVEPPLPGPIDEQQGQRAVALRKIDRRAIGPRARPQQVADIAIAGAVQRP